jgi:hypothetical protein
MSNGIQKFYCIAAENAQDVIILPKKLLEEKTY